MKSFLIRSLKNLLQKKDCKKLLSVFRATKMVHRNLPSIYKRVRKTLCSHGLRTLFAYNLLLGTYIKYCQNKAKIVKFLYLNIHLTQKNFHINFKLFTDCFHFFKCIFIYRYTLFKAKCISLNLFFAMGVNSGLPLCLW